MQPTAVRARGSPRPSATSSHSTESIWTSRRADPRPGRTERRRKDDALGPAARPGHGRRRHLEILGTPVGARARRARGCHGIRRRPRSLSLAHRPAEPRRAGIRSAVRETVARRHRRAARRVGLHRRRGRPLPAASRSGCGSVSGSPPPCSPSRGCWCSTSRPTASTLPASGTSTGCSPSSRRGCDRRPLEPPDGRPRGAVRRGHHCSSAGRVVFSGPLQQAGRRERTSSTTGCSPPIPRRARRVAGGTPL